MLASKNAVLVDAWLYAGTPAVEVCRKSRDWEDEEGFGTSDEVCVPLITFAPRINPPKPLNEETEGLGGEDEEKEEERREVKEGWEWAGVSGASGEIVGR